MKVSSINVELRFSAPMPDGSWRTVDFSAEGVLSPEDDPSSAYRELYHLVREELSVAWHCGRHKELPPPNGHPAPAQATIPPHWCAEHQQEFKERKKGNQVWYSHQVNGGGYCTER